MPAIYSGHDLRLLISSYQVINEWVDEFGGAEVGRTQDAINDKEPFADAPDVQSEAYFLQYADRSLEILTYKNLFEYVKPLWIDLPFTFHNHPKVPEFKSVHRFFGWK